MATRPVAGVWRRQWEEDPLGDSENADRTTLVLWTQAPESGVYVDIRLPEGSPGRSLSDAQDAGYKPTPSALEAGGFSVDVSKLSSDQVDVLSRQKSFAGQLQYTIGDTTSGEALAKDATLAQLAKDATDGEGQSLGLCTCFWRRDIDYQPPSGGLDIGVCASSPPNADGSIDLRETGDDASYAEGWHRLPGTAVGSSFALKLISENGVERTGYWVLTGDQFAYAIGRPKDSDTAKRLGCPDKCEKVAKSVGKTLDDAVRCIVGADNLTDQMHIIGSYLAVYGEVSKNGAWTILHSTDPRLVGCNLASSSEGMGDDILCCSALSMDGEKKKQPERGDILIQAIANENEVIRRWEVLEINGSSNLPGF